MRKLSAVAFVTFVTFVAMAMCLPAMAADTAVEQALGLSAPQPQPDMGPFGCPDDCYYNTDICLHETCLFDLISHRLICTCDEYGDCCECNGLPSCRW